MDLVRTAFPRRWEKCRQNSQLLESETPNKGFDLKQSMRTQIPEEEHIEIVERTR